MADVMRELERLRPVYETGVLRLLLRQNAMLYVSLLRSTFDPLTGELPRETVKAKATTPGSPTRMMRPHTDSSTV